MKILLPVLIAAFLSSSYFARAEDAAVTATSVSTTTATETASTPATSTSVSVATAEDTKLISEIRYQMSRGRKEFKACRGFLKKFKKIGVGGLNIESASHLNKTQALEYAAVLEKYPPMAPGFAKARDLFEDNLGELAKAPDQDSLLKMFSEIEGECAQFSVMIHMSLLFKDVKIFDFKEKEAKKVRKLAKDYFHQSLPLHRLLSAGVRGNILLHYLENAYLGENKEALVARAKAFLADLDVKRAQILEDSAKINTSPRRDSLDTVMKTSEMRKELSTAFAAILADVTF